ncbi:molybdate ABC transporter permease subunit [Paenibacillus oenotherae]|uniref:Molybdenum transport system permease n=1 Tax=Paenibacillus oenotherae TaxID=1435645 RepID=A0ABS7DAC5_9BACL|nr:molybdate ABC transporter permease subunit [Paenibacillus oenotherae]MBW7476831.1 molybdate ABC transporter permease subunit [Paenibacillus oenotherae]
MEWQAFIAPIRLSLQISLTASVIVFLLGLAAAKWMARARYPGKSIIETLLLLPLVLPPTVVGFLLLLLMGRRSWIGQVYEWLFHGPIIFTWGAGIVAAVVVSFPLAYRTMRVGFESVDSELEDSARSIGASEWQVFRFVTLPLAARALTAGYILGFARALGEFGATLMVAGNIPGQTQTIPTAIYIAVDSGEMTLAWLWVAVMIAISFFMLMVANRYTKS